MIKPGTQLIIDRPSQAFIADELGYEIESYREGVWMDYLEFPAEKWRIVVPSFYTGSDWAIRQELSPYEETEIDGINWNNGAIQFDSIIKPGDPQ